MFRHLIAETCRARIWNVLIIKYLLLPRVFVGLFTKNERECVYGDVELETLNILYSTMIK
jgi:hypothetical protein